MLQFAGPVLCGLLIAYSGRGAWAAQGVARQEGPRVFLLNAALLERERAAPAADADRRALLKTVTAAAEKAMGDGPFAVTQKGVVPPSGDKHDYMSQAPYFWPDPAKPGGLPYIRKDGQRNPEIRKITDHDQLGRMSEEARALALAYYMTGRAEYAERAALLLRTWFLDPATRMNPNLEFGQGIPGVNTGRGIGLIETRGFTLVVDAVGLLGGAKAWTAADESGLKDWFAQFVSWMQTSSKGRDEAAAKNNHGTYYDLQLADYALFLGRRDLAEVTLRRAESKRVAVQIEPDGRQPLELARTNAFSYSIGNLDGLMQLSTLGESLGVDLWHFQSVDGRSIRKALEFLLPYATGAEQWRYQQIGGFHEEAMLHQVQRGAVAYRDRKYVAAAEKLAEGREDTETLLLRIALQVEGPGR